MSIPGTFIVIKSLSNAVRTVITEGEAIRLPKIGEQFVFVAKPLSLPEEYGFRRINTSVVTAVEEAINVWTMHTESGSVYQFKALDTVVSAGHQPL